MEAVPWPGMTIYDIVVELIGTNAVLCKVREFVNTSILIQIQFGVKTTIC